MSQAIGNGKMIENLVADREVVALTFKRKLESIDGPGVPIFPPTYPAPEKKGRDGKKEEEGEHRHGTPYTVNETKDGVLVCDLDSVQSQANRMEAAFTGELADVVPQRAVQAGDHRVELTKLPHRIVDASIRATDLADHIREWMEALDRRDPVPLAKAAPTSLIYGAWDSRDTQAKLPRVVQSVIRAWNIDELTRSAQYNPPVDYAELGVFGEAERNKQEGDAKSPLAKRGFVHVPATEEHGGIVVHGEIRRDVTVNLIALRRLQGKDGAALRRYVLGLALVAATASLDGFLRQGCLLTPDPDVSAMWTTVDRDGKRAPVSLDESIALDLARKAAEAFGVGENRTVEFDKKLAQADAKSDTKKKT